MFRGRVAIFFALGAVALAVVGTSSYLVPVPVRLFTSDGDVLLLYFYDGRGRVFWFHSPSDAITVGDVEMQPILRVRVAGSGPLFPQDEVGPPPPVFFDVGNVRIGSRREVSWFGGGWRRSMSPPLPFAGRPPWVVESSYARVPVWPLAVLLMIPPIQKSFAQRRARRRRARNECVACGYSLTGLIEPRCPECGTGMAALKS